MNAYMEALHARNADLVTIAVQYEGEQATSTRMIPRADLKLYAPGTVWPSAKNGPSFTVINHIGAA